MKRFPIALIPLLLLVLCACALGQEPKPSPSEGAARSTQNDNCGIVFGKAHVFNVCAPKGWVLDTSIGNEDGIYAAFYPAKSTWQAASQSGTVMYINTAPKKGANETVAGLMATDAEDIKHSAPSAVIKEGESIKLEGGVVRVQLFEHAGFERFEAVAYVDSPKIIVMFVMTSKDEASFKRDYPLFAQLVKSYSFIGSEVTIERK